MNLSSKIYIAGHRGMVGSAIVRRLQAGGYANLITRTRQELDLLDQRAVFDFLKTEKPNYIFMAAAKVGGIHANNTYPAEFIYQNLMMEANVIDASKPDGAPRKLMDSARLNALGWQARIGLEEGLERAYQDFLSAVPPAPTF